MRLTLAENFRAVFYTPFYLLKELRLAQAVGLELEWLAPGLPGGAIDAIKQGSIDLTWGGPMRVMKDRDTTPLNGASLVCFGEVVARDPFFLLGVADKFSLAQLEQLNFSVVSEVPTPWLCLQQDLRELGVNIEQLEQRGLVHRGLTMTQQLEALQTQQVQVIQLFEPFVSQAIATGHYKILYPAYSRGPTVYTTLICSENGWARHQQAFSLLNEALARLQRWMLVQPAHELARRVQGYFHELTPEVLTEAIARYQHHQVWAAAPAVSRPGFDRLADSLHAGGFIQTRIQYASCVKQFDQARPPQ